MYKKSILFFLILLSLSITRANSQTRPSGQKGPRAGMQPRGYVSGYVFDAQKEKAVEFATVILFKAADSQKVHGSITNEEGFFEIKGVRPGKYFIEVTFIGYDLSGTKEVEIERSSPRVDAGKIFLVPKSVTIEGFDVIDEKPDIEYKIDKKVINVSKQHTAASGTAVDILENVPSVSVDIDGNVALRGSSNFTVLIDGRPTILDANDALEQIPAGTIENIEIITNPSAKYDPDGTSGIINIVMKKGKVSGVSAVVNSNFGFDDKYGGDILLSYRNKNYNSFISVNYNKRNHPGSSINESWTLINDIYSYLNTIGSSDRSRDGYGLRGGIDLYLSKKDVLSGGFRIGDREMDRGSALDFDSWSSLDPQHDLSTSINNSIRSGDFYALNFDYQHKFDDKGHELLSQLIVSKRDMDELQLNELFEYDGTIISAQKSTESGPSKQLRMKLDYMRPINNNDRLEFGYQSRMGNADDENGTYELNDVTGEFDYLDEFSYSTNYKRSIHSLYSLYSGEKGNLGYQSGLRLEYTYRDITVLENDLNFNIDRWDLFPTIHFSMKPTDAHQLMASYTRRIRRPRGWYLEPFETWSDAYNVRIGNPDLKPQFINSFELGYQRSFGRSIFSAEAYYRITENKVEFIRSVYDDNITLHSVKNVGTDHAFGSEFMVNTNLSKLFNINYMLDLYNYRVEGEVDNQTFDRESFSWSARFNNTFNLSQATKIQLNGRYSSNKKTSQGESDGYFVANFAFRQEFMKGALSATLQVNDIFGSADRENIIVADDFYSYTFSERKSPMVMINVSYLFNNFKENRKKTGDSEDYSEDDF